VEINLTHVISKFIDSEEDIPLDYDAASQEILSLVSIAKKRLNPGSYVTINLGSIGIISYPFYRYKNLTSLDLLSAEDIFLFSRYVRKFDYIKNFIDIGSNIGLHSVVARKIGYSVISFEPDSQTFASSKEFLSMNNVEFHAYVSDEISLDMLIENPNSLSLFQAAVSDFDGQSKFTKILDNPTGNHLSGRKQNVYGDTMEQIVRVVPINQITSPTIIKVDAEGEDAIILESVLKSKTLSGIIYLCDWRDETRQAIFNLSRKYNAHSYNPFLKRMPKNFNDFPLSKSCEFLEFKI
jgi:hypothetical protein